jgi:hypothetical protein
VEEGDSVAAAAPALRPAAAWKSHSCAKSA